MISVRSSIPSGRSGGLRPETVRLQLVDEEEVEDYLEAADSGNERTETGHVKWAGKNADVYPKYEKGPL